MHQRHADRRREIETRFGCYRMAWIPLTYSYSPLPGFTACAVQAVPVGPRATHVVRLVLFERLTPPPEDGDHMDVA